MSLTRLTAASISAVLFTACASPHEASEGAAEAVVELRANGEQATAERLERIRHDAAAVHDFVRRVPKGGDLHHHLSGSVYAETYLSWADDAGNFCIGGDHALSSSCGPSSRAIPEPRESYYGQLIGAWSMEGFVPTATYSGHDHFFSTFGKFAAISGARYHGRSLADVMLRADAENEQYIELMLVSNSKARNIGEDLWRSSFGSTAMNATHFASFHDALVRSADMTSASGGIQAILKDVATSEKESRDYLDCGGAQAASACAVATRYEVYVSRSGAAPGVFAQMVAAFEAATLDDRVVALNLVGPEDGANQLRNYDLQMEMLGYLRRAYEGKSPLRLSLHAGELTTDYLPSGVSIDSLDHIRKAVHTARSERIGHGLDILSETNPQGLIADLVARDVLVEICLSSNVQILEVKGSEHPLATYLAAGVPVALATDDQGISRSSIAGEFERAVRDQGLGYRELKLLARNSIAYSFLPGERLRPECTEARLDAACSAALAASPRATAQWELERRFRAFEAAP